MTIVADFFEQSAATARGLAIYARQHANVGVGPCLVSDLVQHFGLQIRVVDALPKSGRLVLAGGDITIQVKGGSLERQRFSACHELGHYLLAAVCNVSVLDQTKDRRFEAYCNDFASHLLLPRNWVREVAGVRKPSMEVAREIGDLAGTSLLASVIALNDACDWRSVMVLWELAAERKWAPSAVVGGRRCGVVTSAEATRGPLSEASADPRVLELPLRVDGSERRVSAQVMRIQDRCFSLIPRSALLPTLK